MYLGRYLVQFAVCAGLGWIGRAGRLGWALG